MYRISINFFYDNLLFLLSLLWVTTLEAVNKNGSLFLSIFSKKNLSVGQSKVSWTNPRKMQQKSEPIHDELKIILKMLTPGRYTEKDQPKKRRHSSCFHFGGTSVAQKPPDRLIYYSTYHHIVTLIFSKNRNDLKNFRV